jgi:small-conductance mechanosensitive channel
MDALLESLKSDWQAFLAYSPNILYALVVLAIAFLVARLVSSIISRVLSRSSRLQPNIRYIRRLVSWVIRVAGILLALGVLGLQGVATSLLATGGVVAIVLGFAFKELGENLLGGLFLAFSRPFEQGDLIKTGDLTGEVKAIEIRSVHIRTPDACDVFVPSAQIIRSELYNYTRDGLRRPSFTVGVAYHDEPEAVLELLRSTTQAVEDVLAEPSAFVSIDEFAPGWVVYQVFFFLDVGKSRRDLLSASNDVKIRCWRALKDAGYTFSTDVTTALDIRSLPGQEN